VSIRVLLVDDQPVVRAGFRVLLDLADDLVLVGEAATGREAIERAKRLRPDVVLMDIRMPDLDGLEATGTIVSDPDLAGVRVIVLTTVEIDDYVFGALRAGASGSCSRISTSTSSTRRCGPSPPARASSTPR
jgi:DNA-binding NarL/FixJ family response regulator